MNAIKSVTVFALACFTLLGHAAGASAAESDAADDQSQQRESSPPAQSQGDSKSAGQAGPGTSGSERDKSNDEVFKPSEEISEDFAVSFPVDI